MLRSYHRSKRRFLVSHDEQAIAIVVLLAWGFGMLAIVPD
jgi:hypothetical protein